MVLKKSVVEKLKDPLLLNLLGTKLQRSANAMRVQVKWNKNDGVLTKVSVLKAISEIILEPMDSLLEESKSEFSDDILK